VAVSQAASSAASGGSSLTVAATAWQGDGLVLDRLERVGEGVYRTTQPIPVHGNWKSLLRLQSGNGVQGVPVFLPEDRAIPAKGVPAEAQFTRTFVEDKKILQREAKESSPWLVLGALALVFAIALGLLALIAWGLHRLAATASAAGREGPPSPEPPAAARERRFRPGAPAPSGPGS